MPHEHSEHDAGVSVVTSIIPTYNRGQMLRRCLESLIQQTVASHHIIVVDDGSSEDVGSVCRDCDHRIEHFRLARASGPSLCRRVALERARSRYIHFMDSDAWFEGRHQLASMIEIMTTDVTLGQVGGEVSADHQWVYGFDVKPDGRSAVWQTERVRRCWRGGHSCCGLRANVELCNASRRV